MSGFRIIDAPDVHTAKALALEASVACNQTTDVHRTFLHSEPPSRCVGAFGLLPETFAPDRRGQTVAQAADKHSEL